MRTPEDPRSLTPEEQRTWRALTSLLVRLPDPADGRTTLAALTEAGFEKVVATTPGHAVEVLDLAIDPLAPGQFLALREIAERIVGTIEERR